MIRNRFHALCVALATLCLIAIGAPSSAQQTREEEQAAEQAAKATSLHPYIPTKAEAVLERVFGAIVEPPLILPYMGSTYPGGSTAFGAITRKSYGDSGLLTGRALWSLRHYVLFDGTVKLPEMAHGRVMTSIRGNWLDAPEVSFWGIGPDTVDGDKGGYAFDAATFGALGRVAIFPHLGVGAGIDFAALSAGPVEDTFEPDLPLVNVQQDVDYVAPRVFVDYDWRESPGYTSSGGYYQVEWLQFLPQNNEPFGFQRVNLEADQFIPIRRGSQVVALRALASYTEPANGETVPYFMMPALGGSSLLRGYPSWRFRDRYLLALTGEFRWAAGRFADLALFYDAGKVVPTSSDLSLDDLNHSFGGGIRLHTPFITAVRLELAKTRDEGIGFVIAFGPSF